MPRIAFQLRLRAGHEDAYDQAHRQVWPELLDELTNAGVREYSIFRRGQELVLCMLVPDFDNFHERMAHSEVNRRWQEVMAPLFEPVPSLASGESIALMEEVFYMPGHPPQDNLQTIPSDAGPPVSPPADPVS